MASDFVRPVADARIFVKLFWGFDPENWPIVSFSQTGGLNRLLRYARPRDLALFVGTSTAPTAVDERGKILGFAEFGRKRFDATKVAWPQPFPPDTFDAQGRFKWPHAVAMTRAWRIVEPPRAARSLGFRIDVTIASNVRLLDAERAAWVLSHPFVPVELPDVPALRSMRAMEDLLAGNRRNSKGPAPSSWNGSVSRDATGAAFTYVLRFGRDVWKIGWADDPAKRAADVGAHVPEEAIGENWRIGLTQRWGSSGAAYAMEQRLLSILGPKRTQGERVACSEGEMNAAWAKAIKPPTS